MMTAVLDNTYDNMIGAVVFTLISAVILIAFLNQRKKPRAKIAAVVCLLSSTLGTSLGWAAVVVSKYQDEASYLSVKLIALGGLFILSPICLFGKWFAEWVVGVLRLQPRKQRILFHIHGLEIRSGDIFLWIFLIIYIWGIVEMWRLSGKL
jgi:glucose-6-phosphate-specific signal transduction histidine kinase